jgi:tetratricopeptide (TPR) repeat protein
MDFILQKDRVAKANVDEATKSYYFRASENQAMVLLNKMPNQPLILTYLGLNYLSENKPEKAIATYETLQKIAPKRSVNLIDLAVLYVNRKDYDKALKIFEEIYQNNKKEETALIYKAYTMAMRGDKKESVRKQIKVCKIETIVENIALVFQTNQIANDLQSFADLILNHDEKEKFNQNTYYYWLKANAILNDKVAIGGVLYSYDRHFTFGAGNFYLVKEIADGVYKKTIQPEKIQEYFINYPNR